MNRHHIRLGLTLLILSGLFITSGCKSGMFSKAPDLAFWKKDNFRFAKKDKDGVAPPSSRFDPEPTHFAKTETPSSSAPKPRSFDQVASSDNKPTREPYTFDEPEPTQDGFGFPAGSKSVFGNQPATQEQVGLPDANQFRAALDGVNKEFNRVAEQGRKSFEDPVNRARQSLEQAQQNMAGMAERGGAFIANKTSETTNSLSQGMKNTTEGLAAKWKDLDLPKPELNGFKPADSGFKTADSRFQTGGGGFKASTDRLANNARQQMQDLNQSARDEFNNRFRPSETLNQMKQDASGIANEALSQANNRMQETWNSSVEKSQQFGQALQDALPGEKPALKPRAFGSSDQLAGQSNGFRASEPNSSGQALAVQPELNFQRQEQPVNSNQGQYVGSLSPTRSESGMPSMDTIAKEANQLRQQFQQSQNPTGNPRTYPTTNFGQYQPSGQEIVSEFTPIEEPMPVLKARPNQADGTRTANLPKELLQGNSAYAPGSVRPLNPVRNQ